MNLKNNRRALLIIFLAAVFSLIWRQGNILTDVALKPFEILIIIATVVASIEIIFIDKDIVKKLKHPFLPYITLLGTLSVLTIVGFLFGNMTLPDLGVSIDEVYVEFGRMIFAFILFFLSAYVVCSRRNSARLTLVSIAISPVVLFVAFLPNLQDFFTDNGRLIGARNDPNYLATFLAIGFIFAASYFLFSKSRTKWLGVGYIILFSPLFLWAYSRAAFLSLFIALTILSISFLLTELSPRRMGTVMFLGCVFIISTVASFLMLPGDSQFLIYRRSIAPAFQSENLHQFMADFISDGDEGVRAAVLMEIPRDDFNYSRGELWESGLRLASNVPWGFGPAYHLWSPVGRIGRAHNLYLEVALTAGWGGLAVFLVLIFGLLKKAIRFLVSGEVVSVTIAVGFIYLLINGLFLDMFTLRWLWLIMGMIVGYSLLKNDEGTKSINSSADL